MGKIRLLHVKEYMANVVMFSILTNSVFSDTGSSLSSLYFCFLFEAYFTEKKGSPKQDIVMSGVSLESGLWTYLVNSK